MEGVSGREEREMRNSNIVVSAAQQERTNGKEEKEEGRDEK